MATRPESIDRDYSRYGFHDAEKYVYKSERGLTPSVIEGLSGMKEEPRWMLEKRLAAYRIFLEKPLPRWGGFLDDLDFESIYYYIRPDEKKSHTWDEVPEDIRNTFDKLGIPEAERKFLAGVSAQYESEVVYHNLQKSLADQGVVFTDTDTAVKEYPELVQEYFGTIIPSGDNKFSALNTAVWSGGSFVHIPEGVTVEVPLQAYFRINAENMGQFERPLIIAEPGSSVHYIEGCTAPVYSTDSLHSAVVEIIVKPHATVRYTTIQNWSNNVYNLVTKRAWAYEGATMEWIDGNLGSKLTMKYPSVYLLGPKAKGETLSVAFAGAGQHQDAGAKMVHVAPETTSTITSKSISKDGGRTTYRGLAKICRGATHAKVNVSCDALLFDEQSRSDTIPYIEVDEQDATLTHEATVGRIGDEQLFYLQSRGLSEAEATNLIVMGFMEPFTKTLPMEYAVEMNRMIELQMEGSVG